jgi:hypothetical protein
LIAEHGADGPWLADLGDLFGAAGRLMTANRFFDRALQSEDLGAGERPKVLARQARWHTGARRWQLLLQAAADLPPGDEGRAAHVQTVLGELTAPADAASAGSLAGEFTDPDFSTPLLIRQAELTTDRAQATDIALALYEARRLPADRSAWLIDTLVEGRAHGPIASILEDRLRRGERLDARFLQHLSTAYTALFRAQDARRADSQITEQPPGGPQGFFRRVEPAPRRFVPERGGFGFGVDAGFFGGGFFQLRQSFN